MSSEAIVKSDAPAFARHVMTEDVEGPVVTGDLEIAVIRRQPLIEDFRDLDPTVIEEYGPGHFFASVSGVALHANLHDRTIFAPADTVWLDSDQRRKELKPLNALA